MKRIISILLVILMCASIVSCSSNRVDDEEAYINDEIGEDIYNDYDSNETDDEYEYEKNDSNKTDENTYENNSNESSNESENSQSNNSSSTTPAKTYGLNETWVVPGRFEFKITSVERHYVCDDWDDFNVEDAVIVYFEIKNIGISPKLNVLDSYYSHLDELCFEIYDENGQDGDINYYTCKHADNTISLLVGGKGKCSRGAALRSKGDKVTIVAYNGSEVWDDICYKANFVCDISNSQSEDVSEENIEKQPEDNKKEDETKWTLDEATDLHKIANNAYSYYQTANDCIKDAGNTTNLLMKLPKYKKAITNISKVKIELNDALDIINKNESVTLTGGDYSTIKEHVEATIKMCEELEQVEFTEENCENLHNSFAQDTYDMGMKCFGLISITLKMKEAFN